MMASMTAPADAQPGDARRPAWITRTIAQLLRDSAYLLLAFPLAVVAFAVLISLFSTGVGLLITLIGLPILSAALLAARGFAIAERVRLGWLDPRPAPSPPYRRAPADAGPIRRLAHPLTVGQYWLDLAHAIVIFAISTVTWCIAVTWWAIALGGLAYGSYDWALERANRGYDNEDVLELIGWDSTALNRIVVMTAVGLLFALTLPAVLRACAGAQSRLSRAMLCRPGDLQDRIETLTRSRSDLVAAEAASMRRLERDIHDGPQQRLVRLTMDLGRAQRQLAAADPAAAQQTVQEALTQTREALDELRALSRGIAPPILADRGLAPALAAVAARCPVEVLMDVDLGPYADPNRLPPAIEGAVYYLVSEALTNVAKHSGASRAAVTVTFIPGPPAAARDARIRVEVGDDGRGGASLAAGHGLAGLADRVHGHGGTIEVRSPAGGPTLIVAELPCG